jgi:branched-chain amino acid transport system ATP-binding protein
MLQLRNLSVAYGPIQALRDVSIHVGQGEVVALIGANGAGKTTMLNAITSLVRKQGGSIAFKDRDITAVAAHTIVRMGLTQVPQGRQIFADQSVENNLLLGAYTFASDRAEVKRRMEREFERFPRLRERRQQLAGTLSGGEQQMLAISRALMINPDFLCLDEPSLGLAPLIVQEIGRTIKALNEAGTTILLVEQMATMALNLSHRAYVLQTGQIVLEGVGRELLRHPEVVKAYLGG